MRQKTEEASQTVSFSQEKFKRLQDIAERIDAVRRLLDTAMFRGCECEYEIRGARVVLRDACNEMENVLTIY
jgi:hypothetical protein